MTTTLNGTGTLADTIEAGDEIVHLGTQRHGKFVSWVNGPAEECANVSFDSGDPMHICNLAAEWAFVPTQEETQRQDLVTLQQMLSTERDNYAEQVQIAEQLTVQRDQAQARIAELEAVNANLTTAVSAGEQRMDRLWVALGDEADRRDWCSEYDDFAERNGGPRRRETIECYATIEVTSELDADDVMRALSAEDLDNVTLDWEGYSVVWSFDMPAASTDVRTGNCGCGDVDWSYVARRHLERNSVGFTDFRVDSRSCDNCG